MSSETCVWLTQPVGPDHGLRLLLSCVVRLSERHKVEIVASDVLGTYGSTRAGIVQARKPLAHENASVAIHVMDSSNCTLLPEGIEWMQAREEHRQTLLPHTVVAGHQARHERPNQAWWLSARQQWTPHRHVPRHDHALAQNCWREIYKIMLSQLNLGLHHLARVGRGAAFPLVFVPCGSGAQCARIGGTFPSNALAKRRFSLLCGITDTGQHLRPGRAMVAFVGH